MADERRRKHAPTYGSLYTRARQSADLRELSQDVAEHGRADGANVHAWRTAGFSELTLGSATSMTSNLGLRADRSSIYGAFLSPSLGVAFPFRDIVKMRAASVVDSARPRGLSAIAATQ